MELGPFSSINIVHCVFCYPFHAIFTTYNSGMNRSAESLKVRAAKAPATRCPQHGQINLPSSYPGLISPLLSPCHQFALHLVLVCSLLTSLSSQYSSHTELTLLSTHLALNLISSPFTIALTLPQSCSDLTLHSS